MLNYIPNRHIKRMFPYQFYNELYEVLKGYTPENVVFLLRGTELEDKLDNDNLEKQFEEVRDTMFSAKNDTGVKVEEYNLYELDQGEFLILDTYIKREDVKDFINQKSVDRYALLVQLFDKDEKPVFSKEQNISLIRQIPEVLWDDPNLAILIMKISSANQTELEDTIDLGVIKAPQFYIDKLITDPTVERTDTFG